ncbi:MAG: energy transducer TonB [Rhodanobacteraceae bacterium]
MNTFLSSRSLSAPSKRSALCGALVLTGMVLLLAGCGQGQQTASKTAAGSSAKPATSASAKTSASAPAALPAQTPAAAASAAKAAAQAAQQVAVAQAKLASMSVPDLLTAAREAYGQHRLIAPAGDNAMEYYEAVLAKDPNNQVAKDALRETFPFGVPDVEKAISQSNFAEASREIDLLSKADPTNYTLTLLRSKLDAQKKLLVRQQQQQQQKAQKAVALAAAKQAEAEKAAQEAAAAKAAAAAAEAAKAEVASRKPARPVAPPPPPKPVGVTHGAKVVSMASPQYPVEAARNQTSGYAVVQFTVEPNGSVKNAHVINSQPRRVFDHAAVQAIERSKFEPAMKNGQAIPAVLQRRIDFKFGG